MPPRSACAAASCVVAAAIAFSHVGLAQQRGGAQPQGAREVTVAAIAGVVAAGAAWTLVWQGTDNADGLVGTSDGGVLFAQEQPNRVSKLNRRDKASVVLAGTHSFARPSPAASP